MTLELGGWFGRYWAVAHALMQTKGNITHAARLLGIHRTRLYALLRDLQCVSPS